MNQYGMITLTNVDVSPDLGSAKIYITALNNNSISTEELHTDLSEANEKLVAELNDKKGFFRQEIAHILTSRGVPSLQFKYDESIERAQRLTDIINSVSQSDDESTD